MIPSFLNLEIYYIRNMLRINFVFIIFLSFINTAWARPLETSEKYRPTNQGMIELDKGERMQLSSPSFKNNMSIQQKFTCQGENINPPLVILNPPKETKNFALVVDDPDAPGGMFVHWVVFNIPPETHEIPENSVPGTQGRNDFGQLDYGGPCPPSGEHRYFFKLYALDSKLNLKEGVTKKELEKAVEGHVLDKTELIGLYKKISK